MGNGSYKLEMTIFLEHPVYKMLSSRFIDCANDYDNEHVIGEALEELFKEGVVKREDLFIQVDSQLKALIEFVISIHIVCEL